MILEVQKIDGDETFKDRVRIPSKYRGGIPEGTICKLSTSQKKHKLVEMRGKKGIEDAYIYMDLATRKSLGLNVGSMEEFEWRQVGRWGQFIWASQSADTPIRVAAQLGLVSFLLGIVSVALGIVAIFK